MPRFGIGLGLSAAAILAAAPPVASSVDFSVADTAGGDTITATGTGLTGTTAVELRANGSGGAWTAAASIGTITGTTVAFVTPALAAGAYDLRITTPSGTSTLSSAIEFWNPGIAVSGETIDGYFDSTKGVSATGSNVTTWTEQSRSAAYTSQSGFEPQVVANAFGTKPGVGFTNAGGTNTNQWVRATRRALASGRSSFWVGKWTSTDATTTDNANNPPLTVVGDSTASIANSHGASAGRLCSKLPSTFLSSQTTFNDGATRLCGITASTAGSNNLTFYSGETAEAVQTQAYAAGAGWDGIGAGRSSTGTSTTGGDGFSGTLGAVVILSGVPSAGYITKLHKWAQCRFGAA